MPSFVNNLAPQRFAKYRIWAGGDDALARRLYAKNIEVAEAFYTPLHAVEITLRNKVDIALHNSFSDFWFDNNQVVCALYMQDKVAQARGKLRRLSTDLTHGHIIAELTFGFWSGMFSKGQAHLWGRHLRQIFQGHTHLQRKDIARKLNDIRDIRNRIAHHEAIIHLDPNKVHQEILQITEWLSPDAAAWARGQCRLAHVCPAAPIIINGAVNSAVVTHI